MPRSKTGPGLNVQFVKRSTFSTPRRHGFKRILDQLLTKPIGEIAVITCDSAEEAKAIQRGFHSSGSARRVKEKYEIKTRRPDSEEIPKEKRGRIVEAWLETKATAVA